MSSPLIKPLEKLRSQGGVLLVPLIMMPWDLKPDLSIAQKDKSKKENRLSIQSPFMK